MFVFLQNINFLGVHTDIFLHIRRCCYSEIYRWSLHGHNYDQNPSNDSVVVVEKSTAGHYDQNPYSLTPGMLLLGNLPLVIMIKILIV